MRNLIINMIALPIAALWWLKDFLGMMAGVLLACVPFMLGLTWGCMMTGFDLGYSLTYHDPRRR